MNKPGKKIPRFDSEAQERAFWESHDSTDYLDWSQARRAVLPNLKPTTKTISLRLPQHLLDSIKARGQCARCALPVLDQGVAARKAAGMSTQA